VAVSLDTFEGAAPAFWDGSSVSAGCTLDRTQTPPVAGWGTQCLHAVVDTNGDAAYLQSGSTIGGDAEWLSFDLCVNAHSIPSGTDLFIHFAFYDAGGPWEPVCAVAIYNDAGTLHLNTMAFYNGIENYGLLGLPAITVGQRHRVAVKYDAAGSLFTVRLDGADVVTQAMAGAKKASVDHHQFGLVANTHAGDDFSFNDFAFGYAIGTAEDTLGALTSAAAGVHSIAGTGAATLAALTSNAGGSTVTGTSAVTLDALTSTATGASGATGTASATLAALTSSGSGTSIPLTGVHTYWRMLFTAAVNGGNSLIIWETEFLEDFSGANVATPGVTGTATLSSTFNPVLYTPGNLLDGDTTTRWVSAGAGLPEWFRFQFDSPRAIAAIGLQSLINQAQMPADFQLQYSDDGVAWTTLFVESGMTADLWDSFMRRFPRIHAANTLADLTSSGLGAHVVGASAATLDATRSYGFGTAYTARRVRSVSLHGSTRAIRTLNATVR
jgi:hypothetical protein